MTSLKNIANMGLTKQRDLLKVKNMLAMSDFIREFQVVLKNDRDFETPLVCEFIEKRAPLDSLIDIGAHWSGNYYANRIGLSQISRYHGIDIQPADSATGAVLDNYYVGNANNFEFPLKQYDAVICVSTIEHSGVSNYKMDDPVKEQNKLFERCLELASKHVFISFPVGQSYVFAGQMSVITDDQLRQWELLTNRFRVKERFFYSQGPQANHPWREHTKRDVAVRIPTLDFVGNCSICIMEIDK